MDATKMEGLAGIADEADAAAGPTPEQLELQQAEERSQAQAEDTDRQAKEWGVLAYMIGGALAMLAPELRKVYTEDACLTWGRSVIPVADKYGWHGPSKIPELGLLLATASLAVPSFLVIRHRIKTVKPEEAGTEGPVGWVASVKAWWRDKRAARTAQVVKRATDEAADIIQQAGAANGR